MNDLKIIIIIFLIWKYYTAININLLKFIICKNDRSILVSTTDT